MDFSRVFGVYSRRSQDSQNAPAPLTGEFRYRVLHLCERTFYFHFWQEVHRRLQFFHGRAILVEGSGEGESLPRNDTVAFLHRCGDEHFLDFIELIFQTESYQNPEVGFSTVDFVERQLRSSFSQEPTIRPDELLSAINELFSTDSLPYSLTDFVYGPRQRIDAYPQVIRRDNEVLDETAIQPALKLLTKPVFASANREFLEALKDYRNGDHRDCVTKCGSSFESVIKVICDQKGWSYQQNDTAETLLNNIFPQTSLESFFKQPIMLVATIRNRLGSAHGAGAEPREVPPHVAHYAINATAAAILLLVQETNP